MLFSVRLTPELSSANVVLFSWRRDVSRAGATGRNGMQRRTHDGYQSNAICSFNLP